jgi:hypothetical protein
MTLKILPNIHHEPLDFDRWLRAAIQDQIVGTPQSGDCPLSRWLSNLHRQTVEVTPEAIWIGGVGYETPDWMRAFMLAVNDWGKPVTARVALRILGRVSEERRAA